MNMHSPIDFPAIVADVARAILGDPNPGYSTPAELRFGSRGSLSVDLKQAVWHDHEAGTGGGLLDLISREIGGPPGAAMDWLRDHGFIDSAELPRDPKRRREPVATYAYRDEAGRLLFEVCRFEPKAFLQRKPDDNGKWDWTTKGVRRVLYRLPEILAAPEDELVYLVEGEKDANRLAAAGLVATTCPGGSGKWRAEYGKALAGRRVVIVPDNDDPGRNHAEAVQKALRSADVESAVLTLEGLPPKGDVSDWLNGGGTPEALIGMAEAALREPDGPPSVPPLTILSYDDMIAMPDQRWLVDGVIGEGTSVLLFGKSNAFKTFLAIDLLSSVATGTPWHGSKVAGPAPVLYVATEGSRGVGRQRIPGWMEAHEIPLELRRNAFLFPEEIALDDDASISSLIATCAHYKTELVVVDIFGASMLGPETSDETARAWVRNVNRIMREVGCAVLTIAHTGWADETRARMHTHFWGSFDSRLKAEGDKDSLTTVLRVDRHKDADSTGEWGFRLDKVDAPSGGTTLVPRLCDEVETTKQKSRASGKPVVALQALSEAVIEHGRTIASPNYPRRPVVEIGQWRIMCDRHGLTDADTKAAQTQAFKRAKKSLLEKGLVRQFDSYVWKVHDDE